MSAVPEVVYLLGGVGGDTGAPFFRGGGEREVPPWVPGGQVKPGVGAQGSGRDPRPGGRAHRALLDQRSLVVTLVLKDEAGGRWLARDPLNGGQVDPSGA